MGSHTTNLTELANRRSQKLPCDGIPFYKVGKKSGLTYSQAFDAVIKDSGSCLKQDGVTFSPHGLRRIIALNAGYAARAQDFLLRNRQEQAERTAKAVAKLEADWKILDEALAAGEIVERMEKEEGGGFKWTPVTVVDRQFPPSHFRMVKKDGTVVDTATNLVIGGSPESVKVCDTADDREHARAVSEGEDASHEAINAAHTVGPV